MTAAANYDDVPHPARSAHFAAHRSAAGALEQTSSEVRGAGAARDAYFRNRYAKRDAAMRAQLEALREPPVVIR